MTLKIKEHFNNILPVGRRSLLFGVHQILWHPITVLLAWIDLYGMPSYKELFCIFIHDIGYWNCNDMDSTEGRKHPEVSYRIANNILGQEYGTLCRYHSRH